MTTRSSKITKHVTAKELEDYERILICPVDIYDYPAEKIDKVCSMYRIKDGVVYNSFAKNYPSPLNLYLLAKYINTIVDGDKEFVMGTKKEKTSMKGKRTTAKKTVRKPAVRKTVHKTKRA